jgi:hypothetical protein
MSNTPIEPFSQQTTTVATSFVVSCRSLTLFNTASFTVDTFNIEGNLIQRQIITMTPEVYNEWQNKDDYVISWAAQTLGFILQPPPTVVVPGP